MKKIYLSMLFAAGSILTQAQVGINQDDPKATLDVVAKTGNTTNDVEGLLIPRVSINKALLMGSNTTTPLQESTMIYVNELDDYTAPSTGADIKVEDITEKGYYFWNGTKWVKTAGSVNGNTREWAYNPTNDRIELTKSGSSPFENSVFYDNATGGYFNGDLVDNIETWDGSVSAVVEKPFVFSGSRSEMFAKASKIVGENDGTSRMKTNFDSTLVIDGEDSSLSGIYENRRGIANSIDIYKNYTGDAWSHFATSSAINGYAESGSVKYLVGASDGVSIRGGGMTSTGSVIGTRSAAYWNSTGSANQVSGVGIFSTLGANAGNISYINAVNGMVYAGGTGNIADMHFINGVTGTRNHFTGVLKNVYGIRYSHLQDSSSSKPINQYGIYLGDINAATSKNYSIYTNSGIVHFGDKVGIGTNAPTAKLDVIGKSRFTNNGAGIDLIGLNHTYMSYYPQGIDAGRKAYMGFPSSGIEKLFINNEFENGAIVLNYGDNSGNVGVGVYSPKEKLEVGGKVKAVNVIFTGISEYADNAAATAAGLVPGEMYRTGDAVKIVH